MWTFVWSSSSNHSMHQLRGENIDPCSDRLWCFAAPLHSSSEALFWVPVWSLSWPDSSAQKFSTQQFTPSYKMVLHLFLCTNILQWPCLHRILIYYVFNYMHIFNFAREHQTHMLFYFFQYLFSVEKCIFFHHFTIVVVVTILLETRKYEFDVKMSQQQSFHLTIAASSWTRGARAAPAAARAYGSARWELQP